MCVAEPIRAPGGPGARPVITLLTDFGSRDAYVGVMKGVISGILPEALVIDICHEISPRDIRRAGIVWAQAAPFFPRGAVHVAVVDPGVGGPRRILAFEARGSVFLAPDNGLIGYVLRRREVRRVVEVKHPRHFLERVSCTFHGRDIFAPVAARLAGGLPLEDLGPGTKSYEAEGLPRPRLRRGTGEGGAWLEARGEVIHVDTFGNALTNLQPERDLVLSCLEVRGLRIERLSTTYSDVAPGEPLVHEGSSGFLEVAVRDRSASRDLGLEPGERITAIWSRRKPSRKPGKR